MFRLQRLQITGFKSFADHTELLFTGDGTTAIVGPNGCGKCVSGDTLVTLADGRDVPIRQLVESALEESTAIETLDDGALTRRNPQNLKILSLNPVSLRLEHRPIAAFIKRTATPHLLRVRTRAGREVTATPYHPLFTLDKGQLRALKAEELKVGIRLALPRSLSVTSREETSTAFETLKKFRREDNVFVPSSSPLRAWARETRSHLGTWTEWSRASDTPPSHLKGLLDGQSVGADTLVRLSALAPSLPPLDGRLKSRGSGVLDVPPRFTPTLARFLGLLTAEGRNSATNQVRFVNADPAVNEEYSRLARDLFGVEVSQQVYKAHATDSMIYSRALCVALERLFAFPIDSGSAEKQAPPQVFRSDAATQWAFLSGLFEGDAYVCARPPKGGKQAHCYIEYTSASLTLARQVVALLLRLGVFAVLRSKEQYASNTVQKIRRTYYSVKIYGTEQLRHAARQLSFVGEKQRKLQILRDLPPICNPNHDLIPGVTPLVKEAARKAGVKVKADRRRSPKLAAYTEGRCEVSRNGLREVIELIERCGPQSEQAREELNRLDVLASSDVYWDEIVSIEQVTPPDEWVYDLSVAETHNFVAGNIIVHNSNISDAISWVLGEQRAKQLRGGEMKDVIFQGARSRPPAGMAEVVLHLVRDETMPADQEVEDIDSTLEELDDQTVAIEPGEPQAALPAAPPDAAQADGGNGAVATTTADSRDVGELEAAARRRSGKRHWRPSRIALEFAPGETVTVARRLYRSGESEYLLNGRECRLRDIQDLFSGTGLAGAHYAIIEQGRIGQILSAKPMDRRVLIEEAAGITKFRVRQRAAEARLEVARGNLRRATDIISEIERQVGSLRRQAAKARRYRQAREELRDLLRLVFVAEEQTLTELLTETRGRLADAAAEERSLTEGVAAREAEARTATARARQVEEELSEARARAAEAALQRDRRERESAYLREQYAGLRRRLEDIDAELKALHARAEEVAEECAALREQETTLRAASEETAGALALYEAAYGQKLKEVSGAEAAIESARSELLGHTAMAERLMEHGRQLEAALERLTQQAEGLHREGERAHEAHEAALGDAAQLGEEIEEARERQTALVAERDEAAEVVVAARGAAIVADGQLSQLRLSHARVNHRLETLTELDERRAQYSQAVQRLLAPTAEGERRDFHCVGTLADMLRVESQWEKAVEGALGNLLQSVIVPTPGDALRAAEWLKANDAGRANFVFTGLRGASQSEEALMAEVEEIEPDAVPRVGDLLGTSGELRDSLERALPRELNARACRDLERAIALSLEDEGRMYVTLDGDWCAGGLVNAGDRQTRDDGEGLLAFKRELRELKINVGELTEKLPRLEARAKEARAAVDEAEVALLSLNDAVGRGERELVGKELQSKQLAQEVERAARHLRVVRDDAARLGAERNELMERRAKAAGEADRAEANRRAAGDAVAEATAVLAGIRREAEIESERLGGQRASAAAAAERRRAAAAELKRRETEREDVLRRMTRRTAEAETATARLDELQRSVRHLEEGAGQTEEESAEIERDIREAAATLAAARARADALAVEFAELNRAAAAARDQRAALDVARAETTARLGYVRETCLSELNQPLEEIARETKIDQTFSLEDSRAQADELRTRIENFGAVNMMALEELAESEERYEFLTKQRKDITDGIASTEEALREIKRRSRERFRHAFEEINRNFGELFVELFGGGRGEMSLIDAEDILESGIDIIAQPPGKRLQNVLLLSGGEKAMAALSLVLAIFRYRPSPFCLLDEVDAPLDEANVGRFTKKILEMSENTQFLIITHNKNTMETARALYGVTMEEAGISKLVSVKFE